MKFFLEFFKDGSCNGLQHYTALGRDLKGAVGVNLVPSEVPQDIYTTVLERFKFFKNFFKKFSRVEKFRKEDEEDVTSKHHEISKEMREFISGPIERKIIKQTVFF